jgi:thioredoxin reductase (NADPH)
MDRPAIVVVHGEGPSRQLVVRDLETRYGSDYAIVVGSTPEEGLGRLRDLAGSDSEVALVLADESISGMPATELLAATHDIHPAARRALLISWRIRSAVRTFTRPWILGQFDYFVGKP